MILKCVIYLFVILFCDIKMCDILRDILHDIKMCDILRDILINV